MNLEKYFDAVIMLTWSDWKSEPRSNRYHYATRFARNLPVLFVQPWMKHGAPISVETTEVYGIDIIQAGEFLGEKEVQEFLDLLKARGICRPLVWIYNTRDYQLLLEALPNAFRVYHATEDYFSDVGCGTLLRESFSASVMSALPHIDLLIGVTPDVVSSYQKKGEYKGPVVVVENGCDAKYFLAISNAERGRPQKKDGRPVAIYQGGINQRLDYQLLLRLVQLLPSWDFWFCGIADQTLDHWHELIGKPNVKYFGSLKPDEFSKLMCDATVGLIPFVQDQWIQNSLPLKAYEYVACGLPVVSVPIKALQGTPMLFETATTAEEFASAIEACAGKRYKPEEIELRENAAKGVSYDSRYEFMTKTLVNELNRLKDKPRCLNVVMLYDERWVHISTVHEHIDAFRKYSAHNFHFVPSVGSWNLSVEELEKQFDLSVFDALIVHYSVRLSLKDYLNEAFARLIENYRGLKLLFIQDEYETTENSRRWMDRLRFDIVYTCVPAAGRNVVYPQYRFPCTDFLPTLTGYVPEDVQIDSYSLPMRERSTLIGYRGRVLPYIYGTLGHEKHMIGVDVRKIAMNLELPVDIEVDDSKRIYGTDWYKFLGSVRATLGTESGSHVFDFDGSVQREINCLLEKNPDISFDRVFESVLSDKETLVRMNQISPKVFEAIRLRTALVLFEGEYSGVVKPDIHFIPLKKDYSNLEEVFKKLQDTEYLETITERAYTDIIKSNIYSYQNFVRGVDRDINSRVIHEPAFQLFCSPILARGKDGAVRAVFPKHSLGYMLSNLPFGGNLQREQVSNLIDDRLNTTEQRNINKPPHQVEQFLPATVGRESPRFIRYLWRRIPVFLRTAFLKNVRKVINRNRDFSQPHSIFYGVIRRLWRSFPMSLRTKLLHMLRG